jgi:hypothetical protein
VPAPTKSDRLFGEIALKNRLLTKPQLEECLKALEKGSGGLKTLAQAIEKKGFLSARAVASIARAQHYRESRLESKLYGRIAVKNKFAEVDDIRQCLEAQKKAYLKGEPPPDFGELLRARGHVTAEEDRAIRDAMAKLDKEQYVGKVKADGDDEEDGLDVGDLGEAEPPEVPAPARKGARGRDSGRAPKGRPGRPGSGRLGTAAKAQTKRKPKDKVKAETEEEVELEAEEAEEALLLDDAVLDEGKKPLTVDTQGIEVEELIEDASNAASILDGPSSSSSVSDSSSSRADAPPATKEQLVAEMRDAAETPELEKPTRGEDTDDLMEVVISRSDLVPPKDPATKEAGAAAAAEAPAEANPGPTGPVEARAETGRAPSAVAVSGRPATTIRAVTPPGGIPRIEVQGPLGRRECPSCRVTLEPGTKECLYCGHVIAPEPARKADAIAETGSEDAVVELVPEEVEAEAPTEKKTSGRKPTTESLIAIPPEVKAEAGAGADPLAAHFDGLERLESFPRGELFRGRDKKSGKTLLVWKLPAGAAPTEAQQKAFREDAACVAKLRLRHVLELDRLVVDEGLAYACYEDAPGTPATVRMASGVIDRMRAARAAREIAASLAETAKAGVFIRELRPEAVIVAEDGDVRPRVAGFGLARLWEPPAFQAADGAPADPYVPPERAKKGDRADVRTDLFGVGAVLKLLLTGQPPSGKEPKDLPDLPGSLKLALSKTLDPATGKRFLDFGKLLDELEKAPGMKNVTIDVKR